MRIYYILDEGLAVTCETGAGQDTVRSLQSAIKYLVKTKEVQAVEAKDLEIYSMGVTIETFRDATPLKPDDTLPAGSTKENPMFVHAPRDYQDLTPEQRRLYANPQGSSSPKSPTKPKPMARPDAGKLVMKPKPKPKKAEPVQVTVRCHDGKEFKAIINPKHKMADLKKQFEKDSGVPADNQVLSMDGKELADPNKTATDSGIKNGSVIDLEPKTIQVFVKTPDGKTIPVTMKPSNKILFIKEKVAPESGIEVPQQVLKFNGKELPSNETAKDMGLKDGSILDLMGGPIQVFVKTADGKTIPVKMMPSDKILFIKEKVAPESGIKVTDQVLTFNGKELPSKETANDMGLKDGSVLDLGGKPIQVFVKTPDGKTIPVKMMPSDKISFIKEKVAPESGIKVSEQVLKFNGKELPSKETAKDMGLKDGSVLNLQGKGIKVFVKTPDGKTIPVKMMPSDKISFIKERVAPESGIKVSDQILKFNGRELPSKETADDMGLKDGSVLDLEGKPGYTPTPFDMSTQRCFYQLGSTVPYYIRINGWEKIGELKQRILETRGSRDCAYLDGIPDASVLKIYAAGQKVGTGTPLGSDETIPTNTSFEVPLMVVWDGGRDSEGEEKKAQEIEEEVQRRMAARRAKRNK